MKHLKGITTAALLAVLMLLLEACAKTTTTHPESITESQDEAVVETSTKIVHSTEYVMIKEILGDTRIYDLSDEDVLTPYYEMATERKAAILNSTTEIVKSDEFIPGQTYTGTAYYISPSGNDENDGLTPETAWKSAHRANWGDIQEGDAVFFERGGTYRLSISAINAVTNATYSAYGEGAKPIITLAQENSARSECWELWHEGENGEMIWRYYQQVGDVAGIVLDDEEYAKRVLEWPTPDGWLALDIKAMDPANGICAVEDPCSPMQIASAGEYRTVEAQLVSDLTYISRIDISDLEYPLILGAEYRSGDLYLRCDAGNPGECYDDIAVIAIQLTEWDDPYDTLFDGAHADGWVLDNLSFKHYGSSAIFSFMNSSRGAVIQNCTVEWGGNRINQVQSEEPTNNFCLIGDGIYCVVNNVTIRNNYMRHGGNSFTFESGGEQVEDLGTYLAEGNLIENCGQGIRTYFIDSPFVGALDELILRNNIIIASGDSMNNACAEEPVAIDLGHDNIQYANRIEVSGNIMIGSTLAMLRMPDHRMVDIEFFDNVIAQDNEGTLITEFSEKYGYEIVWYSMMDALE